MLRHKNIVVFDLDGTLARSKVGIDYGMAKLLMQLLRDRKVAIIGGGRFARLREQVLKVLRGPHSRLNNLILFPLDGSACYEYRDRWKRIYELDLKRRDVEKIHTAFLLALTAANFHVRRHYGVILENRRAEVTFSALGQRASLELKERWHRRSDVRKKIIKTLKKLLRDFEVQEAGLTSIDVTKKGINKAYAVRRLMDFFHLQKSDIIFFGDALFPGGNDYSVKNTGVKCIRVKNPAETKKILSKALKAGILLESRKNPENGKTL